MSVPVTVYNEVRQISFPYLLLSWRCLRYHEFRKERLFAVSKQLVFVLWM